MQGSAVDVALAGCGRWGARILADLVALGARVRVADPSDEARRAALAAGAAEAHAEVERLGDAEGAVVATPTLRHAEAVERLAVRRVPIFCEKPLTADAASARGLAGAHEGRLFVMEKWRWHPAIEAIAALLRAGRLGAPRSLRTRRLQPSIAGYDVDPVWVLAPHELSIATEVLGRLPAITRAEADFERDAVVGLRAGSDGAIAWAFAVSARASGRRRDVELAGERATARWTSEDEHAITVDGGRIPVDPEPPLRRELRTFLGFLRGGPPPKGSAREGAEAVAAIEAARRAAGVTPSGRRAR